MLGESFPQVPAAAHVVTPFVADARGHDPDWTVVLPIGSLFVVTLAALGRVPHPVGAGSGPDQVR